MIREKWEEGSEDSMRAKDEAENQTEIESEEGGVSLDAGSQGAYQVGSSKESESTTGGREHVSEGGGSSMQSGSSAAQIQQYLRGVSYPAAKQDMLEAARSNSAPDDIMSLMNELPDKTYNELMEVEEEFGKIK